MARHGYFVCHGHVSRKRGVVGFESPNAASACSLARLEEFAPQTPGANSELFSPVASSRVTSSAESRRAGGKPAQGLKQRGQGRSPDLNDTRLEVASETLTLGACSPAKELFSARELAGVRISAVKQRLPKGKLMAINVKDGTPMHGPSLCDTCTNAHIEKGYRASEKLIVCAAHEPVHPVQFSVRECTDYRDRTRQSLWEMEKIAWVLAPQGSKRKAGFTMPAEVRKGDEEIELILNKDE